MADIADEIYEATGIIFGAQQLAAMAQFVREREAAARRGGIVAAMEAVKGMASCPFDRNGPVASGTMLIRPDEPCPVCGDLGDNLSAPCNCRSPTAAIRALLTEARDA